MCKRFFDYATDILPIYGEENRMKKAAKIIPFRKKEKAEKKPKFIKKQRDKDEIAVQNQPAEQQVATKNQATEKPWYVLFAKKVWKLLKTFCIKNKEALLYILFGVLATIINIGVFSLCNSLFGDHLYLLSNIIAWAVAVVFAFFSHKLIVFHEMKMTRKIVLTEGLEFLGARALSLSIEEIVLWALMTPAGFSQIPLGDLMAKLLAAFAVFFVNYSLSKFVIFKKAEE